MNSRLATLGAIIALACSGQAETWQTRHGGSFDGAVSEVHADHAVFESEGGRRFSVKFKELDPASLRYGCALTQDPDDPDNNKDEARTIVTIERRCITGLLSANYI